MLVIIDFALSDFTLFMHGRVYFAVFRNFLGSIRLRNTSSDASRKVGTLLDLLVSSWRDIVLVQISEHRVVLLIYPSPFLQNVSVLSL